jgi:hypothetical protein
MEFPRRGQGRATLADIAEKELPELEVRLKSLGLWRTNSPAIEIGGRRSLPFWPKRKRETSRKTPIFMKSLSRMAGQRMKAPMTTPPTPMAPQVEAEPTRLCGGWGTAAEFETTEPLPTMIDDREMRVAFHAPGSLSLEDWESLNGLSATELPPLLAKP